MTEVSTAVALHKDQLETLNAYLQDASMTRILLRGDPGSGRRALVSSAVEEYQGAVLHIVCTPVLSTVPFAALSPILDGHSEVDDELSALRKTSAVLKRAASRTGVDDPVLLVILNAEHIDISSAYVLGQLADAKSARLLMVSTVDVDQCEALMEIVAPDDLRSVVVTPLNPIQVSQWCQSEYGMPLTLGTSRTVVAQCSGNLHLTRLFLELAQRQQALLATGTHWHLKWHDLAFDSEQSTGVQQVHQQLMPDIQAVLEVLAMAQRMTVDQLNAILQRPGLELQLPHVVLHHDNEIQLSPFYAMGLRGLMSLTRREQVLDLLQGATTESELAGYIHRSILSQTMASPTPSESLAVVRTANDSAQFRIASRLMNRDVNGDPGIGLGLEFIRASLATFQLSDAKAQVDQLLHSGALPPRSPVVELIAVAIEWSASRSNQRGYAHAWAPPVKEVQGFWKDRSRDEPSDSGVNKGEAQKWGDKAWISYLQELQSLWNNGQLELLVRTVEPTTDRTLAHAMTYRLACTVMKSRALISTGLLDEATELLDSIRLHDPAGLLYSNGTVELLRGVVAVNQGRYLQAGDYLRRAEQELALHDPESLYDYCCEQISHVNRISGIRNQTEPTGRGDMSSDGGVVPVEDLVTAEEFLDRAIHGNTDLKPLQDVVAAASRSRKHWEAKPIIWEYLVHFLGAEQTEEGMGILLQQFTTAVPEGTGPRAVAVRRFLTAWMGLNIEQMQAIVYEFRRTGEIPLALNTLAQLVHRMVQVGNRPEGRHLIALHELVDLQDVPARGVVASILQGHGLTARELAIVDLLRHGATNSEIARELTVSQRTAEGHVYRTFQKLGIRKRSEIRTLGY